MRSFINTLALLTLLTSAKIAYAVPELCGNTIDDDADGFADETCWPAAVTGVCENPLSCKETGDIAPKTGNLVYQVPLPDIAPTVAIGPKLEFRRTYISQFNNSGFANYRKPMGTNWQHNFMSWLTKSGSTAIVHLPSGQEVLFNYVNTSGGFDNYTPQAGYHVISMKQSTSSPFQWTLKTLTGDAYVYNWSSPTGKLIEIQDALASPNKIRIAYNTQGTNSGQINTVTADNGNKKFTFAYTSGQVTQVSYTTPNVSGSGTRMYTTYVYSSADPTSMTYSGTTAQSMTYSGGYLTAILDAGSIHIADFDWSAANAGQVSRITTEHGGIGFDFASGHAQCSGNTALYFNLANATACNTDSDCGGSLRCGAKTSTGATGRCYRAARCLATSSPSEDLITTVTAFTPCTGACAPTAEYAYNTSTLDLKGVKLADNNWTSYERNSDGMVITMAEGDTDNDATNSGGLKTFMTYDSNFPGRLAERRRKSELESSGLPCDASNTSGCKRTRYTWGSSTGLLDSLEEDGYTLNASNAEISYAYTTTYAYDSFGRITQVDGPLAPNSDDVTDYTYWTGTGVLNDEYLKEVKRKYDGTNYLTTTYDDHDYFGNAGSTKDPDATYTCKTWDGNRNYLTQSREAMNGQTSCVTTHASDLVTDYLKDSWLRQTKVTRPLGDCQHKSYGSFGRLATIKFRDDCVEGNAGDTQSLTFDTNGLATKIEYLDSSGTVTLRQEATYHDGTQMNERINPMATSYSRSMSFAADGEFDTLTFENGLGKTSFVYDAENRQTDVRRYTGTSTYDNWNFAYPSTPTRKSDNITDDMSKSVVTKWDDMARKVRVVSPDSNTTVNVYDGASRLRTMKEGYGLSGQITHTYEYDDVNRLLSEDDDAESCTNTNPVEVQYTYDALPAGVSCPSGASCTNLAGHLAYVKTVLLCDAVLNDNTLDRKTFYGYDPAQRLVSEVYLDDMIGLGSTTSNQTYSWDKNGNLLQAIMPSSTGQATTLGAGGNSDANRAASLARVAGTPLTPTNVVTSITWAPFGPPTQYDHQNTISSGAIRALLSWNLAYRATQIKYRYVATGADRTKIDYTEDEKGRYTQKLYSNVTTGLLSDYLQYDWQDRPTCNASASGSCPGSGSTLKTSVTTYNASNDRTVFKHQAAAYGDYQYNITQVSGADKIASFTQTGLSGSTTFGWDDRGSRTYDDDSNSSDDRRDYVYEGKGRSRSISGKYLTGGVFHAYTVVNAYDHRDRNVLRSFTDTTSGTTSLWWYYYDNQDRLTEVKYMPNSTSTSTYSVYEILWLDKRPVAMWGIDYPSAITGRAYYHSDEANRVIEVMDWPTSGNASVVWALNPDVFGWDEVVASTGVFQPFRLSGLVVEEGTAALKTTTVSHRPAILSVLGREFDPMFGTTLQAVGEFRDESYAFSSHQPPTTIRKPRVCSKGIRIPGLSMSTVGPTTTTMARDSFGGFGGPHLGLDYKPCDLADCTTCVDTCAELTFWQSFIICPGDRPSWLCWLRIGGRYNSCVDGCRTGPSAPCCDILI